MHKVMRREIASRSLAREDVGSDHDRLAVTYEFAFEQAFVDGAKLLHAEVAVVDVAATLGRLLE